MSTKRLLTDLPEAKRAGGGAQSAAFQTATELLAGEYAGTMDMLEEKLDDLWCDYAMTLVNDVCAQLQLSSEPAEDDFATTADLDKANAAWYDAVYQPVARETKKAFLHAWLKRLESADA